MDGFYVEKNNVLPLIKSLEAIAGETGNEIVINVADLDKIASAKKKTTAKDSEEDAAAAKKSSSAAKSSSTKNANITPNFKNNLGFSLSIRGTYQELVNFLIKMENLPYFIKIYNFGIEAEEKPKQNTNSASIANPEPTAELPTERFVKTSILIIVYTNEQ
jgi:hypothetical protein